MLFKTKLNLALPIDVKLPKKTFVRHIRKWHGERDPKMFFFTGVDTKDSRVDKSEFGMQVRCSTCGKLAEITKHVRRTSEWGGFVTYSHNFLTPRDLDNAHPQWLTVWCSAECCHAFRRKGD